MPKHPLLSQTQYYTKTVAFILLFSKVILLYSHYIKKGLFILRSRLFLVANLSFVLSVRN